MNRPSSTTRLRANHIMEAALQEGIFTDHIRDGVCEELLSDGWLERAAPIAPRPHVNRTGTYLPTEKAVTDWNDERSANDR